jgi:hypothetical protein
VPQIMFRPRATAGTLIASALVVEVPLNGNRLGSDIVKGAKAAVTSRFSGLIKLNNKPILVFSHSVVK